MLDLARIRSGRIEASPAPTDLHELVEHAFAVCSAAASKPSIDVGLLIDRSVPSRVMVDSILLRRVLVNLIGNALEFTDAGSAWLAVRPGGMPGWVRFEVHDTGCGIPDEFRPHLFEVFTQATAFRARRVGGAGLGLAISLQLVRIMAGRSARAATDEGLRQGATPSTPIEVVSEVGVGSTLSFELPLPACPDDGGEPWPTPGPVVCLGRSAMLVSALRHALGQAAGPLRSTGDVARAMRWVDADPSACLVVRAADRSPADRRTLRRWRRSGAGRGRRVVQVSAPQDSTAGHRLAVGADDELPWPASPRRRLRALVEPPQVRCRAGQLARRGWRVLVAEDNSVNQTLVRRLLGVLGCTAEVVDNGAEAVARAAEQRFDIILMDCQMPILDGFAATAAIRAGPSSAVPIVALTANAADGDRERCLAAGMDDYSSKPFDRHSLGALLDRVLGSQAVRAADSDARRSSNS